MTFQRVLFEKIKTSIPGIKLFYGGAYNIPPPYFVMMPVVSGNQAEVFCDTNAGEILIQFAYSGNNGDGASEEALEPLQTLVKSYIGNIIYSGNTFQIWQNVTEGIRPLGGASNQTWDAIFESRLFWKKL